MVQLAWNTLIDRDYYLMGVIMGLGLIGVVLIRLFGGPGKKFLDKSRQKLTLGERVNLSHDTVRFRFVLPKATPVLGLPVGKHFKLFAPNPKGKVKGKWNGREDMEADETEIERKYTPTTSDSDIGHVDLIIKIYKGGVKEQFVDGGKMSQYMDTLKVRVHARWRWRTCHRHVRPAAVHSLRAKSNISRPPHPRLSLRRWATRWTSRGPSACMSTSARAPSSLARRSIRARRSG